METISKEEKAKELEQTYNNFTYQACIAMHEWTKQQWIEKACKWLEPVFKDLAGYNCGGDLIKDFKQAMKRE